MSTSWLSRLLSGFRRWLLNQPLFTSTILPRMPRWLRWALRSAYVAPLDLLDRLGGKRDPLVPPHALRFTGQAGDDFVEISQPLVDALTAAAGLTESSKVLDIGSGIGALAIPLTRVLSAEGSYDGLDPVRSGIDWCASRITPRFPNFRFTHADVANAEYNPRGKIDPAEYVLPYADDSFDVVVLYSVFTHMGEAEMEHYVAEIARVLRPGGKVLASYLLINEETRESTEAGRGMYRYEYHDGNHWQLTESMKVPELNIAYDEPYVQNLYAACGLVLEHGVYYGQWSGLPARSEEGQPVLDIYQDAVIATKR